MAVKTKKNEDTKQKQLVDATDKKMRQLKQELKIESIKQGTKFDAQTKLENSVDALMEAYKKAKIHAKKIGLNKEIKSCVNALLDVVSVFADTFSQDMTKKVK